MYRRSKYTIKLSVRGELRIVRRKKILSTITGREIRVVNPEMFRDRLPIELSWTSKRYTRGGGGKEGDSYRCVARYVSLAPRRNSKFIEAKTIAIVVSFRRYLLRGRNYSYELSRSGPAHSSKYESYALAFYERPGTREPGRACFRLLSFVFLRDRTKVSKTAPSCVPGASGGTDVTLNFRACRINGRRQFVKSSGALTSLGSRADVRCTSR